jgi:hypothetical protein
MPRASRRPGAGRKPGVLSRRTIEAVKSMTLIGERALAVLVALPNRLSGQSGLMS